MPSKTYKCGSCLADRMESRFSKSAIRKYEQAKRQAAYNRTSRPRGRGQSWGGKDTEDAANTYNDDAIPRPRCMFCTQGSVHELRCLHCDVVKSLENFSKQMRKNPDNALCHNCSQDRQDLEPHHKDQVQEEMTMERLRAGLSLTSLGTGSTVIAQSAHSRAMAQSNGPSASTFFEASSDWFPAPIPIPDDPRVNENPGSKRTRSPSDVSNAYSCNTSALTGTGWENFERTEAPYREQGPAYRRSSNSNSSHGGGNQNFVKQGAVKLDSGLKAQGALARQQMREKEQSEQAALRESDEDDDDSGDDSDAY